MGDLEDARQLHSHAGTSVGLPGTCTQPQCPPDHLHGQLVAQSDSMAAGFPQRECFKRKEVEATDVLSLGPESLLPCSHGSAVASPPGFEENLDTPLLMGGIAELASTFHLPACLPCYPTFFNIVLLSSN